ncbi:MAG TPA: hypothetical protein VFA03_06435 [Acetobacteraceae bacterium]|nr:hypothetical protein [Acetobacteraceae bacterium]
MTVAFVAPLRAMLRGNQQTVLWHSLPSATGTSGSGHAGTSAIASPASIPGLSGWWDASGYAGMADAQGNPLIGWGLASASIIDRSGGGRPALPYRYGSTSGDLPVATPRISGLLGGCGLDLKTGPYYPTLDYNLGFQIPNVPMGAAAAWTRALVWSRPNWKQNPFSPDGSPNALLYSGATPVAAADGSAGAGAVTLFPGAANPATLAAGLSRRHTHFLVLRNTPGQGVDAWVDSTKLAQSVPNPIAGTGSNPLLLFHSGNGYTTGGGQCWFHEFASWERALTDAEVAELGLYFGRWWLGPRKGVALMFNGQSNAANAVVAAGADLTLAEGVAWHLGAIAYSRVSQTQNGGSGTMVPGMGIYYYPETANPAYPGTFLADPLDGSDPSGWGLGAMGREVADWVQSLPAEDLADVGALVLWWSETDSYRAYGDKSRFASAARRWIELFRAMFPGSTPASLPVIWWNAIPFGNTDGIQMHREVVASLCADPTLNVVMGNPMTADSNNLNNGSLSYDPATGIQSGGDSEHRDLPDLTTFAMRAAPVVAKALALAGRADSLTQMPAGLPSVGGPAIVHAYKQNATTVILTVRHDAGNDLRVRLQATNGAGFLVMDGGSVASPGVLVPATACARVDPTHLQITLAQPLVNPSPSCLLFYPYGSYSPAGLPGYTADMRRGNAVTDNFSLLPKPAGWDIGADLGSSWDIDFPLAATTTPIPLSDSPD